MFNAGVRIKIALQTSNHEEFRCDFEKILNLREVNSSVMIRKGRWMPAILLPINYYS